MTLIFRSHRLAKKVALFLTILAVALASSAGRGDALDTSASNSPGDRDTVFISPFGSIPLVKYGGDRSSPFAGDYVRTIHLTLYNASDLRSFIRLANKHRALAKAVIDEPQYPTIFLLKGVTVVGYGTTPGAAGTTDTNVELHVTHWLVVKRSPHHGIENY